MGRRVQQDGLIGAFWDAQIPWLSSLVTSQPPETVVIFLHAKLLKILGNGKDEHMYAYRISRSAAPSFSACPDIVESLKFRRPL